MLAYGYAGPEACRTCHVNEYAAWRNTGMARMFRPYQPANVAGDFSPATEYSENSDLGTIRLGVDKRPYFEFSNHGNWQRFYVDFTIGSKWQQGYATKLADGRVQVFPIEYNLLQKKWINYWKIIDPPGSPRAVIQDFPKLTSATNYQQNCAICHTSQLKVDAAANSDAIEHAVYLQPGIDCEMCHGPPPGKQVSSAHRNTSILSSHLSISIKPPIATPFAYAPNATGKALSAKSARAVS